MSLTHGFDPKTAIFPTFFLRSIGKENVFYDILEQENAFLGYKNKKFLGGGTHNPSDMCSLSWETHIPSDMCSPTCIPVFQSG